jgi:hypothetical protein
VWGAWEVLSTQAAWALHVLIECAERRGMATYGGMGMGSVMRDGRVASVSMPRATGVAKARLQRSISLACCGEGEHGCG